MQKDAPYQTCVIAALLVVVAVALRLPALTHHGLWGDELQATTIAASSFRGATTGVFNHDIVPPLDVHPPVYTAQLYGWMRLFGTSDVALRLNSVVWSVGAVLSLFVVSHALFNRATATVAALLFAFAPFSIAYAQEVRMYAMLMFLSIWAWFFTHRFFSEPQHAPNQPPSTAAVPILPATGLALTTTLFLYTHGAGFMLLACTGSYATLWVFSNRHIPSRWSRYLSWLLLHSVLVLAYTPWLDRAQDMWWLRLSLVPSLNDIVQTLFLLVLGFGQPFPLWFKGVVVALLLVLTFGVALVFRHEDDTWLPIISFVVVPVLFCLCVSYTVRPIWLFRTLAFTAPFLSLTVALVVGRSLAGGSWRVRAYALAATVGLCVALLAATVYQHQTTGKEAWRQAARFVKMRATPSETIYIPYERDFWCWCWYYIGPGRVDPLTTSYVLTEEGVRLFARSAPGHEEVTPDEVSWLIYQSQREVALFPDYPREEVRHFRGVVVEKLRHGE